LNIQESRAMQQTINAAIAMVQALAAQVDRLEARIDQLEQPRGPGRPRTQDNGGETRLVR
jgi:outer membrane murein-binding lipoprotein Lpp